MAKGPLGGLIMAFILTSASGAGGHSPGMTEGTFAPCPFADC